MAGKLKIGWFSFTCCEDSTIIFTELLNTYYPLWKDKLEFIHARILRKDDTGELKDMDIAFVEGAISSDSQEKKLKRIRDKSKILVAIGSCAVLGSPANQRNFFSSQQLEEIKPILEKFKYKEKVLKLSEVIKVDDNVPGCPMNENIFLTIMKKYLVINKLTSLASDGLK
ncbi:MAG: NADH ubiquinone oxidoreductase, 20 kDa subunit [Candidatus Roizmanbacteria bacterium GW2011_GWA2_36_23]|uniref:NADH ubiquinone oxidoreductase, 20 kDa subunit n=1 Tax=Candidatus Roizmanbacteria bacterium GW2011_GWA2_36_23 TaxID=1618480 RepID=A0A0G0HDQ1_9BACT|nr:MAG: NADH ubiquinone oxidoreductase, 20 kDa subunit [Candidatus Roizmanbacteria bacterium GW2011_GWA2_36_23]